MVNAFNNFRVFRVGMGKEGVNDNIKIEEILNYLSQEN